MRTDLQEENLKGKVKTTVTTYYEVIYNLLILIAVSN